MPKHTQTIRPNYYCLSLFNHFLGLALLALYQFQPQTLNSYICYTTVMKIIKWKVRVIKCFISLFNPSMYYVEKWPYVLLCCMNTARFLKKIWPFYKIMHEIRSKMLKWQLGKTPEPNICSKSTIRKLIRHQSVLMLFLDLTRYFSYGT